MISLNLEKMQRKRKYSDQIPKNTPLLNAANTPCSRPRWRWRELGATWGRKLRRSRGYLDARCLPPAQHAHSTVRRRTSAVCSCCLMPLLVALQTAASGAANGHVGRQHTLVAQSCAYRGRLRCGSQMPFVFVRMSCGVRVAPLHICYDAERMGLARSRESDPEQQSDTQR